MKSRYKISITYKTAIVHGIAGNRRLIHQDQHGTIVVCIREGYSENPGSRHSGLKSYYPAEFEVYQLQTEGPDKNWYHQLACWPVRQPKD